MTFWNIREESAHLEERMEASEASVEWTPLVPTRFTGAIPQLLVHS